MQKYIFLSGCVFFICLQQALCYVAPMYLSNPTLASASKLDHVQVKCDRRSGLHTTLTFDKAFNGVVYALGHHGVQECTFVPMSARGHTTYSFMIPSGKCGTEGHYAEPRPGQPASVMRNTLIVQHDPDFITTEDSAHALSCTWSSDDFRRPVASKPMQVAASEESTDKVIPVVLRLISTATGAAAGGKTNIASGLFQAQEEKNVIISVMDPFEQYDAAVQDCVALDNAGHTAIALTDRYGCMMQVGVMPPFKKSRNPGVGLTLYSTIKDHKLAQITDLIIKCNVQVCMKECPKQCVFPTNSHKQLG